MSGIERVVAVRIPMRIRFRRVDHRDALLLEGRAGWGEFSPFPEYGPAYAARWLSAAEETADDPWPAALRDRIEVNTTVPAVDAETARQLVTASGCRTAKVKVAEPGQTLADDLDRVAAVRDALGPSGHVRVDANGAWDVDTAAHAIARLAVYDLQYAEQPVATLEEMAELRTRVDVALAADESIRTAEDPLRVARLDAADVVVVKVQPLGGVRRAAEVVDAAGLPAVVSSALETSVGLAAGLALAAALPELPYACGLGTAPLLRGDVVEDPLVPEGGVIEVRRPVPSDELMERWAAPDEAAAAMMERRDAARQAAGRYV
ncbi:MAG: o-succinylbenzoate synthase [Nitriliruptorales bacterium]|nr:o-succinylbenzoate synthase [Nitriliruptorales bacterium]